MGENASAGFSAKLYWAGALFGAVNGDVSGSLSQGEVETTTRGDEGWKNFIPGLSEGTVTVASIDPKNGPSAAIIAAIRTVFLAKTKGVMKMTDDEGNGWEFDCFPTKFDWNQPFSGALNHPLAFRICGAPRLVGTGS